MKTPRFPVTIRRGAVATKVYRFQRKDGRDVYTAAWHVGGARLTKQFPSYAEAHAEATLKADQLSAGRVNAAATVTAEDGATLTEARRLCDGIPLVSALQEWAKARELCGGHLIEAAQAWQAKHEGSAMKDITVEDAVEEFIAAKQKNGIDVKASYRRQLASDPKSKRTPRPRTVPTFADAFRGQLLRNVTHQAIQAHLNEFLHPVSRNTRRTRIVSLFRWARKEGYLPQEIQTAAERTDAAVEHDTEIGVVTPEQLRQAFRLIHKKAPHYIPALTLAALCGMRRTEVHAQDWSDIDLKRKFVRVTRAKKNTPANRIIDLNDAAVAWLFAHQKKSGRVCSNLALDRIRAICATAKLPLAENGFRHAHISARVAVEADVKRIALDSGNSPDLIFSNYRKVMHPEEGKDYLEVGPEILKDDVKKPAPAGKAVRHA